MNMCYIKVYIHPFSFMCVLFDSCNASCLLSCLKYCFKWMLSYHFQKSIKQISDSQSSLRWTKREFNVKTPLVTSMTTSIVPLYLLISMEICRILKLISLFSVANYKTLPSFQPPIVFLTEEDSQCCLTGVSTGLRSVLTPSVTICLIFMEPFLIFHVHSLPAWLWSI